MRRPKNNSGVALLMVMVALALIMVISVEIIFTSRIELRIGRNARDRMQASYLAKSAAKFGILRLYMFREIHNLKAAGTIPKEALSDEMIEKIWSMPFPPFPFANSKSTWPGQINSSIDSEGSKIPINLLDANIYRNSNPTMAEQVKTEIKTLFSSLREEEDFSRDYRDLDTDELVENLQDWIDKDSDRQKGGDEGSLYDKGPVTIFPRNDRIPTLTELNMISGWNDDIVKRLAPSFSTINTSLKVNPNHLPLQRIKGFWPKLTNEDLQAIQKHRLEKPFADLKAMAAFIDTDPDVKNGRGFSFPEKLESTIEERVFYLNAAATVGDARKSLKIGIRLDDEAPAKAAAPAPGASGGETPPPPAESTTEKDPKNKTPAKMAEPAVITIEEST